jgi:hypothetical protein
MRAPTIGPVPEHPEQPQEAEEAEDLDAAEPEADEFEVSELTRLKRRNGMATAMLAGALFGLRDVLESPKETAPVTVESSSEPTDIDSDGLSIPIDERTTAVAPPQRNSRQTSRRRTPRRRRKKAT